MTEFPLEGAPTDDQKERLENWLTELLLICRRYGLIMDSSGGEVRVVDVHRETTIGLDVLCLTEGDPARIRSFDCGGSILDGVWLIDTDAGPQEQRVAGNVWPRRSLEDDRWPIL